MNDCILEYLCGIDLAFKQFIPAADKDHEHCNLCSAKFSAAEIDLHYGYTAKDNTIWICQECYDYYKDWYKWNVHKPDMSNQSDHY